MPKCCVCDKEGSKLAQGFWWCKKHYEIVGKELKESKKSKPEDLRGENSKPADLGLKWV